jgi:K(+)-stimulated pyrophosphate-energized sodium pump
MPYFLAASFLETNGLTIAIVCSIIGLGYALLLIKSILASPAGNEKMRQIAAAVQEGAKAYLGRQVRTISVIAVVLAVLVGVFRGWATAGGFVLGAVCSLARVSSACGFAVIANVRTAQGAMTSRQAALAAAFNGGAVTGLLVVGLALLSTAVFWIMMEKAVRHQGGGRLPRGRGAGRVADLGVRPVGRRHLYEGGRRRRGPRRKVEQSLEEDDPRNPATIADNVGDNVGDCAGMAADVFETYAVSLIGAVLVGALTATTAGGAAVVFPFVLGGLAILASIVAVIYVNVRRLRRAPR